MTHGPPRPAAQAGAAPTESPIPLVGAAAALRAGDPALPLYVERLCTRIDRIDPVIRAFVPEPGRYERLAAEARALAARYAPTYHRPSHHAPARQGADRDPAHRDPADRDTPDSGTADRDAAHRDTAHRDAAGLPPLYGVAVGVKDVIQVAGLPTHAGSALPPGVLGGPEAAVAARLRAAGALIAGKTVTAEFAVTAPGPTRNPHDPAYTPGGSSSGSAAAVAAGLVPLAIGTQTIGSVIRPAAYCGVVGFRPTYGRIPVDGVIAHAPSLDTVGLFTADVAGAGLAAEVLVDGWRASPALPAPVLGVPTGGYLDEVEPEALADFTRRLHDLDLTVRHSNRALPDFPSIVRHFQLINRYELAQVHQELFARFGKLYRPETAAAIRRGHEIDRADYAAALQARARFRRQLAETTAAEGIDLWITPAATGPAPRGLGTTGNPVMSLPWSYAGLPAVAVPAGSLGGLPLGLQCVGAAGADERLLAAAAAIEKRLAGRPAEPTA